MARERLSDLLRVTALVDERVAVMELFAFLDGLNLFLAANSPNPCTGDFCRTQ
jgi:hypothetical protein